MPRPMGNPNGKIEAPTDFKSAMKKLIKYLNKFHTLIAIAFLLAATSSILSIIAPNKLSDLADLISDGLYPRLTETDIQNIMTDENISYEDKQIFSENLKKLSEKTDLDTFIASQPQSIRERIAPQIDFTAIKKLAIVLGIIYIISAIFSFFQHYIMATVSNFFARFT